LLFFLFKESEIIEKRKPDGTIVRVRRRAVRLTVHQPVRMTIRSHPPAKKEPVPEDDLSYEEIPVNENSPVHFDKNVSYSSYFAFFIFNSNQVFFITDGFFMNMDCYPLRYALSQPEDR